MIEPFDFDFDFDFGEEINNIAGRVAAKNVIWLYSTTEGLTNEQIKRRFGTGHTPRIEDKSRTNGHHPGGDRPLAD